MEYAVLKSTACLRARLGFAPTRWACPSAQEMAKSCLEPLDAGDLRPRHVGTGASIGTTLPPLKITTHFRGHPILR